MSIVGVYLRILFKDSFKGTFKGDPKSKNTDEDQSTEHFLEEHFETIGKWVQRRQTIIFTVAKILHDDFYGLF